MNTHPTDAELSDLFDAPPGLVDSRVREHVTQCERCRSELASLDELRVHGTSLGTPIQPPVDLWPRIVSAAPVVQRNRRRRRASRFLAVAAAIVVMVGVGGVGGYMFATARGSRGALRESTPTSPGNVAPDAALLQRAAAATRDGAFYERRRAALEDSLSLAERQAIAASPIISARRQEIDSLLDLAAASPANDALADAVARSLDAWYFDVQHLRRQLKPR